MPAPARESRTRVPADRSRTRRAAAFRLPRYWPVVAVFVAMTVLQASLAVFSIHLLSAVRAYVTGESLYSKGQKDAQIYLIDYAERHQEADYVRFMEALAVPLGDRDAREALQQQPPDLERARRGFLTGGNHPDDIPGLIRLFLWFRHVPFMSEPVATWTEGDRVIEEMRRLAERARTHIRAGATEAEAVAEMRRLAPKLNTRLTQLENQFSAQLGEASRTTQQLLLGLNGTIALLLLVTGLAFVRRSDRVQAAMEAEVVNRQESLQRLLDSVAEGLYGVDLQGRCTFINQAALRMLGYRHESELLGRDIHALIHHSRADGSPHPASESNVYQAYRGGLASHASGDVFWCADGSSFPVEYWTHPVVHDGEVQGAVATFFDITERIRMQDALRRGELRMERLIDTVTDGVITIDTHRSVILFNRAAERMFGTPATAAVGTPIDRFIVDPTQGALGESGSLHELVGQRADGQEFPLEASLSRLETANGVLTTIVLRDVSALHEAAAERRAREALEAANQAKTAFLSRMSHELRTPLNAVIGFTQLMRLDAERPLSPEQLERAQHIESAGAHLLALVNDVLDLSRIESGEMSLSQEVIQLSAAVEEALTMVSPLVTEAGVEVFVASPDGHTLPRSEEVWVKADRVRLRQVLVNLLSNAVKYNRPGGSVSLSWTVRGVEVEVRVVDTGYGIPAEKLARLFEPFNRLGAEASKVQGTGIGLVLSRHLSEMMGGALELDSSLGTGTTASLTLRAGHPPHDVPALPATAQPSGAHSVQQLNVLYAEDNEVNAELVRQLVTLRPAVQLRVASSGAQALEMARADPPDLLLVDMNLGDMTGAQLARELRRSRSTREIPLVALSADALPAQIDAAMRMGFEAYLTKPVNFRQLLAVLDQYLNVPAAQ
jgi:PAS domain S-box-containing protein